MRRVLASILLTSLATSASPEVVTARSGEHDEFTRIVFYYPESSEWQFNERRREAVLSFDDSVTGFEIDDIFTYIPRDRLRDVSVSPSQQSATLEFACDCDPRAWQHSNGVMVVDIYGDPSERTYSYNLPELRYGLNSPTDSGSFTSPSSRRDRLSYNTVSDPGAYSFGVSLTNRDRSAPQPRPRPQQIAAQETQPEPRPTTRTNARNSQSNSTNQPTQFTPQTPDDMLGLFRRERVSEAQERLVEQIIRGVAQGSLQADFDPTLYAQITPEPPAGEPMETEVLSLSPDPEATKLGDGGDGSSELPLRAETTIDRDSASAEEAIRARGCVPASDLNFSGMVAADRFSAALADARANQASANGEARAEADETLALTYMYWGFGAEAIQTLRDADLPDRRRTQLIAQAEIIDQGYAENPLGIGAHPACEGPAAFWTVMAPEEWPGGLRVNSRDILATFNALPAHLRRHLGQRLVERLIEVDAIDVAQEVQRILLREQPDPTMSMQLSSARIAIAGGDVEVSEEELASIARSGTDDAALALLDLTDLMLGREELVPDDLIQLLAAYAFENRSTPLSERLLSNRALALTRKGSLQPALELMDDELAQAESHDATLERLYDLATKYSDDTSFLRLALSRIKEDIPQINHVTTNAVARRLLSLGFPDQALYFIEEDAVGPQAIARQILRAESALQLRRPADVEIYLLGLENQTASRLRAEATAMLEDHDHAYEAFSALGARQEAERQAVLGRDWTRLTNSEDEVLRRAAEVLAQKAPPEANTGMPSLAGSRALIEGSENARDALGDLILRYAPRDEF